MFSVDFALIISRLIKESFNLECMVTDEKGLILISTYDGDKPYGTDGKVRQFIEHGDVSDALSPAQADTIIPINNNEAKVMGFVHIKSELEIELHIKLAQFIQMQFRYDLLRTELELEHTDNEKLIEYILSDITPEISKSIKNLASRLNYDINHPMAAIVVQMEENKFSYFNMDMGYSAAIKVTKERIIKEIRNHFNFNNRDIIAFTNEGYLVVVKAFFSMEDLTSLYMLLHSNVEQIDIILGKYKIFKYVISNGHIVDHYSKIRLSYREAIRNIEISKMIGMNSSKIFPEDILYEKLIDNFSVELIEMEIMPLIKKISKTGMERSIDMLKLFDNFCACDFNISDTANMSFLHRNTVSFKLEKLREITGLDPMGSFKDRLLLNLLYSYIKMYKPEAK